MKKSIQVLLFILILSLGIIFRTYKLTSIPPGVNRDEASIGYTAYSLLLTGRDEYGKLFPLSFQSFGDWKLPVYIYETFFSVKFFGLNELAVRLPSVIAGIISIVLTFFLVLRLTRNKNLAYIVMFLASVSPWSIHLSRVESESNTAVVFTLIALCSFYLSFRNKSALYLSSFFFSLCYFTYAGNYVSTTLLVLGLVFIYRDLLIKNNKAIGSGIIFCLLSVFIWKVTIGANTTKLSGINIFGDPSVIHAQIEIPRNEHVNPNGFFTKLVHNRLEFGIERFIQNYLNSFSPQFLFIQGGTNHAHNIKDFGNMYIVEAPFLLFGIVFLFSKKRNREENIILWWLISSPIAASLTKDAPHTNRMFAVFPVHLIVVGLGIWWVISLTKPRFKKIIIFGVGLIFIFNIALYFDRYFIHFPRNESRSWGIGYKKLTGLLMSSKYAQNKIVIENPETSPYIYLLFYGAYDPNKYQKVAMRYPYTNDGFLHIKNFDRFEFRAIDWEKDLLTNKTTVVAFSENVPLWVRSSFKIEEILAEDNTSQFTIVSK